MILQHGILVSQIMFCQCRHLADECQDVITREIKVD